MNFRPDLAEKVIRGEKVTTRRLPSANSRSPWFVARCGFVPSRDYAVCPGRGKHAVGRIRVVQTALVRLGVLSDDEARREGFDSETAFRAAWVEITGGYESSLYVWRVDFEVAA